MTRKTPTACCDLPNALSLRQRPPLTEEQVKELIDLFKVFGNDTRLRLLHTLACEGELCVTDLAERLEMKPQAVTNQLQRLVDRDMLASQRNGNSIYYRIVNPCAPVLLEIGLCLIEGHGGDRNGQREFTISLPAMS